MSKRSFFFTHSKNKPKPVNPHSEEPDIKHEEKIFAATGGVRFIPDYYSWPQCVRSLERRICEMYREKACERQQTTENS